MRKELQQCGRLRADRGRHLCDGRDKETSFKGYYRVSGGRKPFLRTFLLFDGEGDTANARERAIGGHPAVFLRWRCRYRNTESPYADE